MNAADQTILHKAIKENLKIQMMEFKPTDFKCGDCAGPFSLDTGEKSLKIMISNFTGEMMKLEIEENEVTKRIQTIASPLLANCVVLETGKNVQILFTKDIESTEPLRAILVADMNYRLEQEKLSEKEKKYECPRCHMAKFNSLPNLKIHEELYCTKKDDAIVKPIDNTNLESHQNLILLPLAYHDLLQQNAVQVMGPLNSILPVAVSRKSAFVNTNPLFVRNKLNLDIPQSMNLFNLPLSVNIPVVDLDEKIPSTSTAKESSTSTMEARIPSISPSCSPTSKSSSSEPFYPDRPFSCTCGVSFSSQTTYDAHRQLYCSHTVRESSTNAGPNRTDFSRKVPEKCTKCDFVPATPSQLSLHIRSSHQTTKTFTCLVCGYRAFSMRGVRTHMRSHPSEDSQRFKANDVDDT
ncbi:Protein CBG12020 [Caenorhabditis briggsae]|uniref:Protein CBG12020 n=3 Tax=Caenorhabditis briggsae TaxID=6238 RepID=A8XED2_CAEBR|nr:Protein CBG12020 [Caenorhabditis briggsae]ULU11761.1 hypothetical protein L3Y34_015275 [Caenorhabditis briggsae]CAP31067.1 Protein CBG12020 [Caenorhabditis briggsae]